MRLHVISDLHVEFGAFEFPMVDAEAVVLAGDIGLGTEGVRLARRWSADRPVLFVATTSAARTGLLESGVSTWPTMEALLRGVARGPVASGAPPRRTWA